MQISPIVVASFLAICGAASAQTFPYDQFERTTLAAITKPWDDSVRLEPPPTKSGSGIIEGPIFRKLVRANYAGQHRPTDSAVIDFMVGYEKAHHLETQAELYKESYLFRDGGSDYWLPVQNQVAGYFEKELKTGASVDLYLVATGGFQRENGWTWVLPVEEFEAVK